MLVAPSDQSIAAARVVCVNGGWWAPVTDAAIMTFDFGIDITLFRIRTHPDCINQSSGYLDNTK